MHSGTFPRLCFPRQASSAGVAHKILLRSIKSILILALVPAVLLTVALSVTQLTPESVAAAQIKLGVGLTDPGQLTAFDISGGRRTDIFLTYADIRSSFLRDELLPAAQSGHIIQLAWEPWVWDSSQGANQPAYRLKNITRGDFDNDIRRWARDLRDFGYPIRIRPMCEMNGDWTSWSGAANGNSPADFIPAWRHVHDIFAQEGAVNVSWIWSPNRDGSTATAEYTFSTYYPGDVYVDYVGLSGYNWGTLFNTPSWISKWESFTEVFQYSYDVFAARTLKPLVISETAAPDAGGDKGAWVTDAFRTLPVRFPRFESLTWFNYIKETDWRLEGSAASLAAFRAAVSPLDTGPPNIYFDKLASGASVRGDLPISVNAADDNAVARVEFYLGEIWLGSSRLAPFNLGLDTHAFNDGRYSLTAVAFDYAGKQSFSRIDVVINNSDSRNYYFNWYDSASPGMRCFIIIANPGARNEHAEVFIAGQLVDAYDVPAAGRVTPVFDGRMGGPVRVVSTTGGQLLVSERSLYNGNFTEIAAATAADLATDHYVSWYDESSPGMRAWILMTNQGAAAAEVDIDAGGTPLGHFHIPAGGIVTPDFPGVMAGPIRVRSTNGQPLTVSARTTYGNSFNETSALPGTNLSAEYLFSWYDTHSPGMRSWIIINNLSSQGTEVQIFIGNWFAGSYAVPAGGTITPEFPGRMDGPVKVVSTDGQPLAASLRSVYLNSLEEVGGAAPASLTASQWFSWYDSSSPGMRAWIMVGNMNADTAIVRVKLRGVTLGQYSIPAGGRITPILPGLMDGPLQITEASGKGLLVSQRVLYNNSFNELWGSKI